MDIFKNYKNLETEIGLLTVALLFVIASLVCSYYKVDYTFFGRSGSILTLCAIIVEYRLYNAQVKKVSSRIQQAVISNLPLNAKPTPQQSKVSKVAHSFVVLGTVIWGYGDLLQRLV